MGGHIKLTDGKGVNSPNVPVESCLCGFAVAPSVARIVVGQDVYLTAAITAAAAETGQQVVLKFPLYTSLTCAARDNNLINDFDHTKSIITSLMAHPERTCRSISTFPSYTLSDEPLKESKPTEFTVLRLQFTGSTSCSGGRTYSQCLCCSRARI